MLVRLLVEVDMFSVFPYYGLEKEKNNIIQLLTYVEVDMECY